MADRCPRCGWRPIIAKQLCRACYDYQHRTHQPRPPRLIVRHVERRNDGHTR